MSSPSDSPSAASTVDVLAANRTHRPDPLNSFEMYTGGWNISDVHYLASAGYTGMPGFVISLLWVLLGFGMLLVAGFMLLCCPNNLKAVPDFGSFGNYTTLGLLILFTVFTICGCGSLFTGQEALHSDLSTMFTYLMTQVDEAANEIVSNLPPIAAPRAALSAAVVEKATNSTSTSIHHDLDEMRLWLIILTATMLVLALIGLVSVACHFRPVIYTLVTVGWLLVMGTWILFGVFLLVEAVIGDTCVAMKEWVENPRGGTSFDIIMKCKSSSSKSSSSSLSLGQSPPVEDERIHFAEYKFVNDMNQQNHDFYHVNIPNRNDHQGYSLWIRKSIQIKTTIPTAAYDTCSQIRSMFVPILDTIVTNNCPSMRRNSKWVQVALGVLSWGSMMSISLWIVFTRRSTMRLTKIQAPGNPLPLEFEETTKKKDAGSSSATGYSTPTSEISINVYGGGRKRSKAQH